MLAVQGPAFQTEEKYLTYAQTAIKKQSILGTEMFTDKRFLLPISKICGRFFSCFSLSLNDNLRSFLPANIEKHFRYMDRSSWDLQSVQYVVTREY